MLLFALLLLGDLEPLCEAPLENWEGVARIQYEAYVDPKPEKRARDPSPLPTEQVLTPYEGCWDEARRVVTVLRKKPTRLERLDAALLIADPQVQYSCAYSVDTASAVNRWVRRWAINEITASHDPREWDPKEVAHLIWAARKLGWHGGGERATPYDDLWGALRPMGFRRIAELLGIPKKPDADFSMNSASEWSAASLHFTCESFIYEAEWNATHSHWAWRGADFVWIPVPGDVDADAEQVSPRIPLPAGTAQELDPARIMVYRRIADRVQKDAILQGRYFGQRWLETDRKAPHPDMALIRAELKKLEASEPSPTKIDEKAPK